MDLKSSEITNAVYKIVEFFPEEEPLKKKIKEKSLEIMEGLVSLEIAENNLKGKIASQILKDIEIIKSYLELGKLQGWVDNFNLLILFGEYNELQEKIKPLAVLVPEKAPKDEGERPVEKIVEKPGIISEKGLTERQSEILKVLQSQDKTQVADLQKFLPKVTKRTLRRDLDDLLKKGRVTRAGEWNQVFYQINNLKV